MPATETGFVRDADGNIIGEYREVTDENGDTFRREEIDQGNGKMKIVVEKKDGTRKEGIVEPGAASDQGLGN